MFNAPQAIGGVPALLVYRHGEMIGNFVRLGDELGDEFCPSDVESFLVEYVELAFNYLTLRHFNFSFFYIATFKLVI